MNKPVRVRFAPSPTGPLHIGGVRTALFNYLFAKKHGGTFYIRIEDTDQTRFVAEAEDYIFEALEWLGISPDETIGKNEKFGPYRQSDRKEMYKQYADELIQSGWAYYAFDTPEKLDELRKQAETEGKTFIYNHTVREKLDTSLNFSDEIVKTRIVNGEHYVIRFKTPVNETLHLQDIIRGEVHFDTNLLDDKVLFKSDGMPTYHLANIVDDHLMETSHVIRGEEWLPSMPLHVMLYRAFGWEAPEFAHLPLILKPNGKGKLSKRDGEIGGFPVFPLAWKELKGFKEVGYLPEALLNFLVMIGWNDGSTREDFTLEEMCKAFDLGRVHKAGAKFDIDKAKSVNQHYLQTYSDEKLANNFKLVLTEKGIPVDFDKLITIVSYIKVRANFVSDFWDLADYFFVAPTSYDEKASKNWKEETPELMKQVIEVLNSIEDFTSLTIENTIKEYDFWNTDILKIGNIKINLGQTYFLENRKDEKSPTDYKKHLTKDVVESILIDYDENIFLNNKDYLKFIKEFYETSLDSKLTREFFNNYRIEIKANNKYDTSNPTERLNLFFLILENCVAFENDINEIASYNLVKSKPLGKVMQPLRLSLVGALKGPHLFDIIELIGKEETSSRIEKAIATL